MKKRVEEILNDFETDILLKKGLKPTDYGIEMKPVRIEKVSEILFLIAEKKGRWW